MKRFFLLIFIILLSIMTFSQAKISFTNLTYDYGIIPEKSDGTCTFQFVNSGNQPLTISNVTRDCGCVVINSFPTSPISPKKTGEIILTYDTKRIGQIYKRISVFSNDLENPVILSIKGTVIHLTGNDSITFAKNEQDESQYYSDFKTTYSSTSCKKYLEKFPTGRHFKEVNTFYKQLLGSLKEVEEREMAQQRKKMEEEQMRLENELYQKAINDDYNACTEYLNKYPRGKYVQEVKMRKKTFDDKYALIKKNSNKLLWKLGDKICLDANGGIICCTLEKWNEDKSKVQIKIVTGPGGSLEGESVTKNNLIWVSSSGKGWHLCVEDEIRKSINEDNSEVVVRSKDQLKYHVGDKVQCLGFNQENTAGWYGIVVDKNYEQSSYCIKIIDFTHKNAGFLGLYGYYFGSNKCTGNVKLSTETDIGKTIWVPRECIE